MTAQAGLWWAAGAAALVAVIAAFLEHRRVNRRDLDRVGWAPWGFLQVAGAFGAVIAVALALKG